MWDDTESGEQIILYGDTGIGKTSLCALAPKPVFIGLDNGGRKLRHPVTNEPLKVIPGVETYLDVRSALQQADLFDGYDTVVIDTVTLLQDLAVSHMLATIPTEKGAMVKNIVGYGYNKGYQHLYDVMKLILVDCEKLINKGKNVILVAQSKPFKVVNPSGEDFLREGPRLHSDATASVEALYCEWADHVLRVDYLNAFAKDKKVSGDTTRGVFIEAELHFRAKSRTVHVPDGVVSYEDPSDDNIWQFIFNKGVTNVDQPQK